MGNVVAAFESEWSQSRTTLASLDLDSMIVADGEPVRAIRLVIDVLQESARHLGHIDILRELIDGVRGEWAGAFPSARDCPAPSLRSVCVRTDGA
jgi:hypothetical protein